MTDRINALTVVLEDDIREDDVQQLVEAIRMMRWVSGVELHVRDHVDLIARVRVDNEWTEALLAFLKQRRDR